MICFPVLFLITISSEVLFSVIYLLEYILIELTGMTLVHKTIQDSSAQLNKTSRLSLNILFNHKK